MPLANAHLVPVSISKRSEMNVSDEAGNFDYRFGLKKASLYLTYRLGTGLLLFV